MIIIFETRHTGLIMASLNVLVKLPPSSPFRLSPVSLLAFAASFLPPVFISIFLNFLGYARGKYLVLQHRFYRLPRVRHSVRSHTFSRSEVFVLFPFCLQYFLSYTLCFGFVCFQCFPCYYFYSCSADFSLIRESNSLSDYQRVGLLSLEPRLFLHCPHCTTLSFRLQFPVSTFPSDGSREWYIRWLRFFFSLIERL